MTNVALALGSNLGDRLGNLRAAIVLLGERGVAIKAASSVWETAPVPADQPAFLNAAVVGSTVLDAQAVLQAGKEVEYLLGRRPGRRWGPRPADLDILFFGDAQIATAELTVPHASIVQRAFVLVPLSEVMRGRLPVLGETALALLQRLGAEPDGMRRVGILATGRG